MKKIINDPLSVVNESLEGLLFSQKDFYEKVPDVNGIIMKKRKKKVSVVSGGGSGHEPMLSGLVGEGMLDGVAMGSVFASPDPNTISKTIESADQGDGVLCLVWNYAGDTMNFAVAQEFAMMNGVRVEQVVVNDDVASATKEDKDGRRGVAGMLFVAKIAGAAAAFGYSLQEVKAAAEKANGNLRSIGIALTPCSIPGNPPNFIIGEDEFEYGMGIHGEPGIKREKLKKADEIVDEMMEDLIADFGSLEGKEVIVFVNGMAATTSLELNIINRRVNQILQAKKITVYDNIVNSYCTSLEMAGASISIMVLDEELKKLYNQPAYTPCYYHKGK
ncbi:MAG: dihydroxyacetone kinase subunit DhaK [Anaerostipes sp.]|nr:dihydroxyacetone kinase subunit DhaK [Anaerostipes sp.]